MTTAQSNRPDPFEASSGFSPEEAERLASAFKPSWEFDEAPFTQGGGMDASELDRLAAGGVNGDIRARPAPALPAVDERGSGHAKSAAARTPPARVETHEPDVSVIIDRSITASEMAHAAQPAPHIQAAPVLAPPPPTTMRTGANPSTTAKRAQRRDASESLEIPKALRSSNKGLFIGIGVAAAAAVAILAIRAATASGDAPAAATTAASPASTTANAAPAIPPIPAIPPPAPAAATAYTPAAASPQPATQARVPAQAPAPHRAAAPPPHRAAPKSPPKATGGGIVRDVPF